jgi:alpha-galactosidase
LEIQTQKQDSYCEALVEARHITVDLAANWLDHPTWKLAPAILITRYWSGTEAPEGRHAEVRLLWSAAALHIRFTCRQSEPMIVAQNPQTKRKTLGLWDRDVCETFIAPDPTLPYNYFEFEAAATGEWVDLGIEHRSGKRETDFEFKSGMSAAGKFLGRNLMVAMRIPWQGPITKPKLYERWRINLYRCIGSGENRGYLAWRPTLTEKPDFHVPEAFGELHFT